MKCPHCHALCMDTDKICLSCRQPVGGVAPERATRAQRVGGAVGLVFSMICFFIADHYFPKRPEDTLHVSGLIGGLAGWAVGYALGMAVSLRCSKDEQQ